MLSAAAEQEIALAGNTEVTNPVRVTARGDEISRSIEREEVDRRPAWLSGLASADLEDSRTPKRSVRAE